MTRDALRDGYVRLMEELYEPEAYFGRLEELFLKERLAFGRGMVRYWHVHPWTWLKALARNLATSAVLFTRLMQNVPEASLRKEYRKRLWRLVRARPDTNVWVVYLIKCMMHYHQYTLARQMAAGDSRVVNSF
jgi:hypothetical protein